MRKAVDDVLCSGWLTSGPQVKAFETEFAQRLTAKHAIAVNSCTSALHLALEAVGVGPGDQVIVPTMTFAATAEVVRYLGADPVLVDVCPETALITPEHIKDAIKESHNIKACMPVHFGGLPCDMHAIRSICEPEGIFIIDDAAHAFPASLGESKIGTLAEATCFSFYANKTLATGEGGMLVTDNDDIAERARTMRLHGMNRDAWGRFTVETSKWEYDIVAPGYKYNMPDLSAALGLSQIQLAEEHQLRRTEIANRYYEELSDISCIQCCATKKNSTHAWHLFWICLLDDAPISRNALIRNLDQAGVSTSVHYKPLHRMSYWKSEIGLQNSDFPNAESLWKGCLSLPIYPSLTDKEQSYVIESIKSAIR